MGKLMNFLPTFLILIGYFIISISYTIKNRKSKIEKNLFINEILIALLFLNAGVLFPLMYQSHSPSLPISSLQFMWFITSTIFLIEMIIWLIMLIYNARVSKKNPSVMAERDYNTFREQVNKRWTGDLKSEFGRKILHLFTCSIIFIFWSLGTILNESGILLLFNLDNYSFSYWLIITVGFGFVIMFQIADLARLNKFYSLPKWSKRWYLSMRPTELDTFVASTPLVLSFVPFIFAPFPILASVALIATGADAVACIIGKRFGKHSLRKKNNKTIEGFIAGGLSTFFIVVLIMTVYNYWIGVSIVKIILMASVSAVLFLVIDIVSSPVSDNILNPIITGISMWLIFLF